WTWVSGVLLAGLVYWMGDALVRKLPNNQPSPLAQGPLLGISLALILLAFFLYDALWKAMAKQETAGAVVSFVLLAAAPFGVAAGWGVTKLLDMKSGGPAPGRC